MKKLFLATGLALAMQASGAAAATCADRTHVVTQLQERFGERLVANSISPQNHILEVYAAPEGATWTILVSLPERGLSCLVATGEGTRELHASLTFL